eukprot:1070523_1
MDNASPFTIAKNKKRPLYHLLSLTESASPRPAKKQKKAKSTSLSHSQSHPNNFGITGINEAGQICINGPMLSEFDPRPTVNSILAGQYKPRKKCNISKWKQQPYNIGIFAESNDHNNKRRSQYRKSIETVLIPGKDTTQKVKIESVKSVIKQRDRKKAEAHARAKAKAEATKAAAEAARAKEEDAKADDDEDVKAADESIESSDSGSSDDDIPIDAPKRKLKYASSSESESSSSYESESD